MTAKEAIDQGIQRVRLPTWNKDSYLELPVKNAEGLIGPWAKLYDPISTAVLKRLGESCAWPIMVLFPDWSHVTNFEPFTGRCWSWEEVERRSACAHQHLNEDRVCDDCGADRQGFNAS